ncbi:MAG: class I SAM-dependent methyltransferase [Ferrimicrobium sp.]
MISFRWDPLGDVAGRRVLDLGAGTGRHVRALGERGAWVVAGDLDLQVDQASGGRIRCDAHRLPFLDGAFDVVVISEVIEHVADPARVLAECGRVTAASGRLVCSVPRYLPEALNWLISLEYHSVPGGHIRIVARGRLRALLREAGVEPVASHHSHALHSPYWWLRAWIGIAASEHSSVVSWVNELLCREMVGAAPRLTKLERLLNPVLGKSFVVYAKKGEGTACLTSS